MASYRVVIANERSKRDGEFLDYVGTYDTNTKPSTIVLNKEAITEWIAKGAQPTDTVKGLMIRAGMLSKPKKTEVKVFKVKPGKKATERASSKS